MMARVVSLAPVRVLAPVDELVVDQHVLVACVRCRVWKVEPSRDYPHSSMVTLLPLRPLALALHERVSIEALP